MWVELRKFFVKKNVLCSVKRSFFFFFFSKWVFFHEHSRMTGLQGKGEDISLTPHYQIHPLRRHLDISWAITAESSPLHMVSSRTRTGNFGFRAQVANHEGLQTLLKRDCIQVFSVKFEKFLKTPFFTQHLRWLFR